MVTLRTYLNPTQALLDKALLDSNEIFCAIADQNANLYGGAPFAMPVRLLVAEEQAEEADRVLKNPSQDRADSIATVPGDRLQQRVATNNPWELLAIAALLLLPGLMLLLQKHELILLAP